MNKILSIMILALAALTASAQDDFDPTLPGEPNVTYKVTVGISHSGAGTVAGGGSYPAGTQITISRNDASLSSSSIMFYKFKYWTLNGEEYTDADQKTSFTYTVGTHNAVFQAVYEAVDPDDVTSKVFLIADPSDACTFNKSNSQRYFEDSSVYIYYNPTSDSFKFEGWYENGELISSSRYFYYTVGKDDSTITAHFSYEPGTPDDPSDSGQTDVDSKILGDADNNGVVNVADVTAVVSYLNGQAPASFNKKAADVNGNDEIDLNDVNGIVNIINSGEK